MEELILGKARELFFSYGLKRISMDDLARRAGVSKKTIYQVVADKQELVMKVVRQLVQGHDECLAHCRRSADNAVHEAVLQARQPFAALAAINCSFFYDLEKFFPEAWQLVQQHRNDQLEPHIIANLGRGIAEGLYRDNLDVELTADIRLQQLQSVVLPGPFANQPFLLERLTGFYLHGITNSRGSSLIETYLKEENLIKA